MNLKNYIGNRRGKEANELEREALNDPFLQDAIDGFDTVQAEHLPVIEQLEKQISGTKTKKHYGLWLAAAASLTLLVGISLFFNFENQSYEAIVIPKTEKPVLETESRLLDDTTQKENTEQQLAINTPMQKNRKSIPVVYQNNFVESKANLSDSSVLNVESDAIYESAAVSSAYSGMLAEEKTEAASIPAPIPVVKDKIRGVVVDEKGEPLIGASVKLENGFNGTITDLDGKFELPLPKSKHDKLVASYIGYENSSASLLADTVKISMKPNDLALNEVVVIGYGSQKRTSMTGAISSVSPQLSGKASGISVKRSTYGEKEFKIYFEKNRTNNLCQNQAARLTATFDIDTNGKPTNLTIVNSNCLELTQEFTRLLNNSPTWTRSNRQVRMIVTVN